MVRRKFLRFINAIIAFSFLGLLVVYIQSPFAKVDQEVADLNHLILNAHDPQTEKEVEKMWNGINFSNTMSPLIVDQIIDSVHFLNANYELLNVDKFGPVEKAQFVIAIQVHNRIEYLRILIDTLKKAKYIENALLIFSHDYSSQPINDLIKDIQFARVLQIFYPFSIQLFPNVYPGEDPNDCPEKLTKNDAELLKCNNWEYPDKYGHYRVAKLTQIKHHWWWKINYIFDGVMKRYKLEHLWVLFLEEDHYVSPDFLHVLKSIIENKSRLCEVCEVISLGFHLGNYTSYVSNMMNLGIHPWFSSKHNMGMAINSVTWKLIKNCSQIFCTYDDYNWDWSLMHVSAKCLPKLLQVIFTKAPRVLHIGDCGVHTHRCAVHNAAQQAKKLFLRVSKLLFPTKIRVMEKSNRSLKPSKENGGWGDKRDHELCLNNSLIPSLTSFSVDRSTYTNRTHLLPYDLI